ncbi:MAG: nucleotide sugar dehydrogenase [Rhodospirillaceae bacterium]|nr:nucleotide sugar dehydrogenase [Rhodospirillaceae bacterium]
MDERIAVVGLGYVGLPVALGFAREFEGTLGVDINAERVAQLKAGVDVTGETDRDTLLGSRLDYTHDPSALRDATTIVVSVPTPVDGDHHPDLRILVRACETIGAHIRPGAMVVFESTVYPGVTRDVCGPAIARASGLQQGRDFRLAYSPERINPGDREHTLERIVKVVSGEDAATLERVAGLYGRIIPAGIHRAPSIEVAEAAKVIENIQRDLNVALMNELALIFHRLGLRTADVLAAARTKWNFLPFTPGLVGGHCIGVDPYYLTARAQQVGYYPEVILAGRRINDGMGRHIAQEIVKALFRNGRTAAQARIGILGITFKENVPDLRNSRVPDIAAELASFGLQPLVHDPMAGAEEVMAEYGLALAPLDTITGLDALVLAVPHRHYLAVAPSDLFARLNDGGLLVDVKSVVDPADVPGHVNYWSL